MRIGGYRCLGAVLETGGEMSEPNEDLAVQPSMLARAEEIQQEIQQLFGRDLQLWSIGILVILVLTGGMLALLVPNVVCAQRIIHVDHAYLPQLFFVLISLVCMFKIYLIGERLALDATR